MSPIKPRVTRGSVAQIASDHKLTPPNNTAINPAALKIQNSSKQFSPKLSSATSTQKAINSPGDTVCTTTTLYNMFQEFQATILKKIDDANVNTSALVNSLRKHMDESYAELKNSIDTKIKSIQSEVLTIADGFRTLANEVDTKMNAHNTEISAKMDQLERREKQLDVIVKNVPKVATEDLSKTFADICHAVGLPDHPRILSIYRMRITSRISPPIVIKFLDNNQKLRFMNAYMKSQSLSTEHLGFETNSRVYINESLSRKNATIFSKALTLKKSGLIRSVASKSGLVFIKYLNSSVSTFVSDMDTLMLIENHQAMHI